jgi:soluble lytic murein transglycosylase-like protein
MIWLELRPFSRVLALGASAAIAGYMPQARADVFEMSSEGQWQQINERPYDPLAITLSDDRSGDHKMPPVRLAAIAAPGEPVANGQVVTASQRPVTGQYGPMINAAATQYGISPALVDAVMWQESRYNSRAVSSAGAIGLMQLMPGTARTLGVDPHDPWQNVFGGAAYLRKQLDQFNNNVPLALAAYNAGPGAVIKYGGVPPYTETRNYVSVIMRRLMSQGQRED